MPIKLPNLDDRTFADLVQEAQALIPVYSPEWTNHNESDPGITLIELFAYLTEMLMYRLNRVTDANVSAFLKLIDGIERIPSTRNRGMVCRVEGNEQALGDRVRDTVSNLRSQNRTVTCEEYERLVSAIDPLLKVREFALKDEVRSVVLNLRQQDRAVTPQDFERLALAADPKVKRAACVPQRDLTKAKLADRNQKADAHVSVVVVSSEGDLTGVVSRYLEPRRLLTTRVHVVPPRLVSLAVHVSLTLKPDAVQKEVDAEVRKRLAHYFNPVGDEHGHTGWPFGRDVYVSEVYRVIDRTPGVDFVTRLKDDKGKLIEILTVEDPKVEGERRIPPAPPAGALVAIKLYPDELVNLNLDKSQIVLVSPVGKDSGKDAGS
ncbi:MAG TPA: baseplate J/gp47 family protein [Pyrinomonadaceae bacterium]